MTRTGTACRVVGSDRVPPRHQCNGTPGVSGTTISLGDQPELRIDFNKLVSTGTLSANGASVYGGELAIGWRNLLVQGEYYQLGVTQAKLPNVPAPRLGFNGGYVEGGWVLTGEPIPTIPRGRPGVGQRSTARSASPMAGSALGSLSARYSTVSLTVSSQAYPKASPAGSASRSSRRGPRRPGETRHRLTHRFTVDIAARPTSSRRPAAIRRSPRLRRFVCRHCECRHRHGSRQTPAASR